MASSWIRGAAAALLASCALAAGAASVTLTGWAFGEGHRVAGNKYSGAAGGYRGTLADAGAFDADPFVTYCVELTESFWFSAVPMLGYSIVAGEQYFGAEKADRLGRLLTYVDAHPAQVDTSGESTALQLAIWNIVYDQDFSVSASAAFNDSSSHAAGADQLLAGAQATGHSAFAIFALQRGGKQDFLLAARLPPEEGSEEVPEPEVWALVLLGLALSAAMRRRVVR